MQKLNFKVQINAPKEKVWDTMLNEPTYREWTAAFMPGGYFEGNWDQGSKIRFVAPDENGKLGGMLSEIAENRPYEFISIRHRGIVNEGVEDTTSDEAKEWDGALENYTLKDSDGGTELTVDTDVVDSFVDDLEPVWPKALQKLKELAES